MSSTNNKPSSIERKVLQATFAAADKVLKRKIPEEITIGIKRPKVPRSNIVDPDFVPRFKGHDLNLVDYHVKSADLKP